MRKVFSIFFVALLLAGVVVTLQAQKPKTVDQLNSEIRKAEEDIKKNSDLLNTTRASKKTSERELKLIQDRISSRRKIVAALQDQIALLDEEVVKSQTEVGRLGSECDQLKREYAAMIRESYKNYLCNNYLALIFASKDFNDVTLRINYMRRYNALRERKHQQIDSLSRSISARIVEMDEQIGELDKTKANRSTEIKTLGTDEQEYKTTLDKLRSSESNLSRQITASQTAIRNAQKEIARIIAEENKKESKTTRTAEQQREVTALTGRFDQNKGKLPYPVRGGVIIDSYGVHPHPTQKGLTVDNKGVNIACAAGSQVRCVFEGTVSRVFFFQGLNNGVIVRHGDYMTVYSNLATVALKTGDKVALNQVLGTIAAGTSSDDHMLHFEIWKESTNLNPQQWLIP